MFAGGVGVCLQLERNEWDGRIAEHKKPSRWGWDGLFRRVDWCGGGDLNPYALRR
jgi:hypothetical protein